MAANGQYTILGSEWSENNALPKRSSIASSGFGDGAGSTAASISILFGGSLAAGIKAGVLWLEPGELVDGTSVAPVSAAIEFGLTVRERTAFLLRV